MIAAAPRTTVIIVAMLFVLALGLASYQTNGFATWSGRLGGTSTEQLTWNYQTNTACLEKVKTKPMFCIQLGNTERITLGILGDSTANSLVPGLADYAEARNTGVINIGQGSCPPIRGMLPTPNNPDCPAIVAEAYRIILQDPKIDTVILALFTNDLGGLRFRNFPEGAPLEAHMNKLMAMLDADIHALHAAGKKVILTYDTPLSPVDAKECLHRLPSLLPGNAKKCRVAESEIVNRHPQVDLLDTHYQGRSDVCVFHQSPLLFTDGYVNFKDAQGRFLIRDRHHLSAHGSREMAKLLEKSRCGHMLSRQ